MIDDKATTMRSQAGAWSSRFSGDVLIIRIYLVKTYTLDLYAFSCGPRNFSSEVASQKEVIAMRGLSGPKEPFHSL